ncbi:MULTISPECIES: hypothetical protein [Streptosporangiaceae]|uniref:hypothetical protein n=1 Tax=Streptosporangiaceae TaxID=2004 RepID=UPI0033F953CD
MSETPAPEGGTIATPPCSRCGEPVKVRCYSTTRDDGTSVPFAANLIGPPHDCSASKPYTSEIAKLIRVERVGSSFRFEINGEPFPYALPADEPLVTRMERGSVATVQVTIMAERVEFIDAPFSFMNGVSEAPTDA